jgi:tRNA threonylcarbamoyladenosine modification (KEOPS) complex Cgi121 subunit
MPQESAFHCLCWEIEAGPGEIENILSALREDSPGVIIQIFGANRAPNAAAVEMIAAQTLSASKSGSTLAERPELDLLLRLAGTRQIGEAFRRAGYKSNAKRLFVVAASDGNASRLGKLGRRLSKDRRFAEVAKNKLGKIDLEAIERAALLSARL